jgi:hypothetical protein
MILLLLRHWLPISLLVIVLVAVTAALLHIRYQKNTIDRLTTTVATRDAAILQQNHAIEQMKIDSSRRQAEAAQAVELARRAAQPHKSRAAAIIVQPPQHNDSCASAIELLDEYLP